MNTKKCWHCQETKSIELFSNDRRAKDGKQKRCKDCDRYFRNVFKYNNPEYFKNKGKEYYHGMSEEEKENYNKTRYRDHKERYKNYNERTRHELSGTFYQIWKSASSRAKTLNREFTITREWVEEQYSKQDGKCLLTGIPFECQRHETLRRNPWRPSIDRIDCKKGYTEDNCRLICVMMNLALCDFGEDAFSQIAQGYLAIKKNRKLF